MCLNMYLFLLIVFISCSVEAFVLKRTSPKLIEGDIIFNPKDGFRLPSKDLHLRWPSAKVYYLFSQNAEFEANDKSMIRQAMDEIQKSSCVRFEELNPSEIHVSDFLVITSNPGCYSSVGRQGGPQEISLQTLICFSKGVILHELMHTLGFYHEQSRIDRDDYVEILWNNISEDKHSDFDKYSDVIDDKIEYDYESIMHYEFNAFAKSSELTSIKPLNNNIPLSYLGRAKQIGSFTQNDWKRLNKYYEC